MRVISGSLRGRPLKAPPGDATRPTGSRVKEALFSILGDVSELAVLDLYAGSGALGIEALSRGARAAVFLESARPALSCLRENLTKLGLDERAKAVAQRVESATALLRQLGPFDLILCDPPWKDIVAARAALELLAGSGVFAAGARIVLEHAAKEPPPAPEPSLLRIYDERRWGDTAALLLEPADVPAPAAG